MSNKVIMRLDDLPYDRVIRLEEDSPGFLRVRYDLNRGNKAIFLLGSAKVCHATALFREVNEPREFWVSAPLMRSTVYMLFGGDESLKTRDNVQQFDFDTVGELNAFLRGVEANDGWQGYTQFDDEKEVDDYFKEKGTTRTDA